MKAFTLPALGAAPALRDDLPQAGDALAALAGAHTVGKLALRIA
jgi:hypothetical protein